MEGDPTGGMWIYLIFFMIPLVRIIPRLLKKYRQKNTGLEPEPAEKGHAGRFFTSERMSTPSEYREPPPPEPQPKPDKKDGWVGKDDFKR
tara:strand:- start:344 stop:613 length:270 start_codon:yes stop_codon:yes gene_type:complete